MPAMSLTVPISLLASMMLTRTVLSVMASRICSGETRPDLSVGRYVTWQPIRSSRFMVSSVALCSVRLVMKWLPFSW
jgi:multidrug efflux pump subunit AcrB